nr:MAG TPA: adhesin [Caudoviricetes sp.]
MKRLLAVICASLITLTGCKMRLTEGEICDKQFLPAHTQTMLIPMTHTNGKTSYTTYIPMVYSYPDRWCIRIQALNPNDKGRYESAIYYVTKDVYDECEIGELFKYDPERDFKDEPVEKKKGGTSQ